MSYDMIDRYLRNNLHDDDYAEYSAALEAVAEDAARVARIDEARRWAKSVDELTLLLRATDARYMARSSRLPMAEPCSLPRKYW